MKKVSIKDVAREAGVSVTTVSHILNHNEKRFSKETIHKVMDAKEKLGYFPNKNAQQLRGSKIKLIGVLLPSLTNPFFSTIMQSMDQNKPEDVDLFFLTTTGKELESNIKHLVERGRDGLVIGRLIENPEALDTYLKKRNVPYVVLDQSEDHGFTDMIRTDENAGGQLAAEHLVELGHRSMAIVQPYEMMTNMKDRVHGFMTYCQKHGISKPAIYETTLSKAGGASIVPSIIESKATAVFAINDELAIGIMRGMADRGMSVPNDLSLVGYDDIDFARYIIPSLTTVAQPMEDIGALALTLIMKKIQNQGSDTEKIELPNKLVVRETTRRIN
ncbi:ribose utilization transcriptional repressor RbsR [Staphylococcus carnosus]|uniref:ribose utilization transcriptional repressor RbsR n=1 Tax=Staphylococcus carnosus TaxID=1281 RepID=UPI00081A736F|nr:LacI family DNA-binding transcriptional regulator [Staphylococcus carnosus]ANZ34438.1 LacI family transcriptional regulator [Staphylococcus carnosus]UTB79530.1 LacI family transcriptional regulator [Staphylococcus carnosus]UTB84297.1 LacI family transcriptional regulator [Staphylococcus carnosus]